MKWFRPNEEFWEGRDAATQAARARLLASGVGTPIEPWEAFRDPEGEREASADELLTARPRGLRLVIKAWRGAE
jgi:hypothetical protein